MLEFLFDFISGDMLNYAIRNKWHNSFRISDLSVKHSSSGPNGKGVSAKFKLQNKLKTDNHIISIEFYADDKKVDISWPGRPQKLSPKEIMPCLFSTYAIHPHEEQEHEYKLIIKDIFDREYSAKYKTIV
jgi:hypothetical protein